MSELFTRDVGGTHLVVKPSVSLQTPVGLHRSPGVLSRTEILRRREASEQTRKAVAAPAPIHQAPAIEMHEADMTPLPKNKGGRPKKQV